MSRRRLDVGADGKANVMLLTDPIPRHLSIVSWGANDRPATSWKSADAPSQVLRSPPGMQAIDVGGLSLQRVQHFVTETLDAWGAVVQEVLATPLSAAERASRIQGHTAQAGARIAAFTTAVAPRLASATASYRSVADLSLPIPPDASTLQGEIDRRRFVAGLEQASAVVMDKVLNLMKNSDGKSPTENILALFGQVGGVFAKWASSMPSGVVGVSVTENAWQVASGSTGATAGHSHSYSTNDKQTGEADGHSHPVNPGTLFTGAAGDPPHRHKISEGLAWGKFGSARDNPATNPRKSAEVTQNAGSRHNKRDKAKLNQILALARDILGVEEQSTEKSMTITLEDLKSIAGADPVGFLNVLNDAFTAAKSLQPEEAKKFMWGDTGVESHTVESIMGPLRDMIASDQLAGLIASAVGGVNLDQAASGDSPQVAATMRSAFAKVITHELTNNSDGELATAIKSAVAPSFAEAIRRSLESIVQGDAPTGDMSAFGLGGFSVEDGDDPLAVELPSLNKPA